MNAVVQSQNQGYVQTCLHCEGTGHCHVRHDFYRRPEQFLPRWQEASCFACHVQAGLPTTHQHGDLTCGVCRGKGLVWIGPEFFSHR